MQQARNRLILMFLDKWSWLSYQYFVWSSDHIWLKMQFHNHDFDKMNTWNLVCNSAVNFSWLTAVDIALIIEINHRQKLSYLDIKFQIILPLNGKMHYQRYINIYIINSKDELSHFMVVKTLAPNNLSGKLFSQVQYR